MPNAVTIMLQVNRTTRIKDEELRSRKASETPLLKPRTKENKPPKRNISPHCNAETSLLSSLENASPNTEAKAERPPIRVSIYPSDSILVESIHLTGAISAERFS